MRERLGQRSGSRCDVIHSSRDEQRRPKYSQCSADAREASMTTLASFVLDRLFEHQYSLPPARRAPGGKPTLTPSARSSMSTPTC